MSLQHYQLKIVYINGKANANADSLWEKTIYQSQPEEVELAATDMRATVNTEKDQRENDYKNVVSSGNRVLPQNKHVDRQELIIKLIINNHGNSYSNNKTDMDVARQAMPLVAQAIDSRGPEGGPASKTIKGQC